MSTATPAKNEMAPPVATAGMKPGDAQVDVVPKAGGGYTLSPLPVGGRRKSRKGGKSRRGRRGGADEPMAAPAAPAAMGARRRKSRKTKKAGRRH